MPEEETIIKEELKKKRQFDVEGWHPKTEVGKLIKRGEIKNLQEILSKGKKIMEAEIVDILMPEMETDLLLIGQSKGKFGGGQRRIFRQTQKKTKEGNKPKFATYALVGNRNGIVGVGYGKSKETVPAREKSLRNAKLNVIMIRRGCGSWQCNCHEPHSIPFKVSGKTGSLQINLIPAPKGTGLIVEPEVGKILKAAGIKDVWSKTKGQTKNRTNVIEATMKALRQLIETRVQQKHTEPLGMAEGEIKR
jgi:small subunit ribosomal protein S5